MFNLVTGDPWRKNEWRMKNIGPAFLIDKSIKKRYMVFETDNRRRIELQHVDSLIDVF